MYLRMSRIVDVGGLDFKVLLLLTAAKQILKVKYTLNETQLPYTVLLILQKYAVEI